MSRAAAPDRGAVAFAERLIALLDEGTFTATYKFAVLLALLDVCLEGTTANGEPPASVATADLARRVTELYWPQTNLYVGLDGPAILRQNSGGQAEIIRAIRRFREQNAPDPSASLAGARAAALRQYVITGDPVEDNPAEHFAECYVMYRAYKITGDSRYLSDVPDWALPFLRKVAN